MLECPHCDWKGANNKAVLQLHKKNFHSHENSKKRESSPVNPKQNDPKLEPPPSKKTKIMNPKPNINQFDETFRPDCYLLLFSHYHFIYFFSFQIQVFRNGMGCQTVWKNWRI